MSYCFNVYIVHMIMCLTSHVLMGDHGVLNTLNDNSEDLTSISAGNQTPQILNISLLQNSIS